MRFVASLLAALVLVGAAHAAPAKRVVSIGGDVTEIVWALGETSALPVCSLSSANRVGSILRGCNDSSSPSTNARAVGYRLPGSLASWRRTARSNVLVKSGRIERNCDGVVFTWA